MFEFKKEVAPTYETKQKELWLYPSGFCTSIDRKEKDDGYGPYVNGIALNRKTGMTGTFLIELSDYSMEEIIFLVNQNLNFELRHNGPKLKSLELQPKEVVKLINEFRENLFATKLPSSKAVDCVVNKKKPAKNSEDISLIEFELNEQQHILDKLIFTATQRSHDLGLPMFMGVCIPSSKKYKK